MTSLDSLKHRVPPGLKPPLRYLRQVPRAASARVLTAARISAYRDPSSRWLGAVPGALQRRLRLPPPPPGQRRLEIGSGPRPQPGYIHVDRDPSAAQLDLLAGRSALPVADGWADEVLSVHMIEHVPPPALKATLADWYRVLRPGGTLIVHTPSGEALGQALAEQDAGLFWAVQGAIYGYGGAPTQYTGPAVLADKGDHKLIFTLPSLQALLEEAGFSEIQDLRASDDCPHASSWNPYLPGLCLAVSARKPNAPEG